MAGESLDFTVSTAEAMHALGRDLSHIVRAGDLIILGGVLGAGKTQLTQGIGEGLLVTGAVTSPTFVISRVHKGPRLNLVHVDAYRLGTPMEIDDLDLEAHMLDSVTVVEWGKGLADHLSEDRLDIEILRSSDPESDVREVVVTPVGARWSDVITQWERAVNELEGQV